MFAETPHIKGFSRSTIYDLPRKEYYLIPNSLYDIISKYNKKPIENIYIENSKYNGVINEYFQFLKEKETFFLSTKEESKLFPKINLQWDFPAKISNSIIEIDEENQNELQKTVNQLINIGCYYFQIFSKSIYSLGFWETFLESIKFSPIKLIDIFTAYYTGIDFVQLKKLINKHKRLKLFFIFNSKEDGFAEKNEDGYGNIYHSKQSIELTKNCGLINHNYFNVNIQLFTESQHYNTCLNRKICIDKNGEIKNCPAMSRSFGNIKDTTLEEAINKPGFKDLWGIRKDDIDVCKDCEFRYMCTDCRAFIKDPNNIYSQPAKCPYNPYIAKWEGEDGYITVEQWRAENPNWEKKAKRHPLVKKPQPVE